MKPARETYQLDRRDVPGLLAMAAVILSLHGIGIVLLVLATTEDLRLTDGTVFGVGLGLTAYTLGMRHAFDADHIAAVDNTTRKLVSEGGRPLSVGFWFALGHSSVVFVLCLVLALGVRSVVGEVVNSGSTLHVVAGIIGSSVAGVFLLAMGLANLISLIRLGRVLSRHRRGGVDDAALSAQLDQQGFLTRLLRPVLRGVDRPSRMYPVGLLFGLGFDTATEISLLALAGGAAITLPWYALLSLPILFAAGMCLFDTMDGVFMRVAYGWAFERPFRRAYYNVVVTATSVVVALVIGGVVLAGLVEDQVGLEGLVGRVAGINLDHVGYAVVALFILVWALSLTAWKVLRLEQRWDSGAQP